MLTLTSKHKYDKKKNINMSTGKEKNNLNILSGLLRSRCIYRTIPKFLVHHLFFKKFSSGVLPNTSVALYTFLQVFNRLIFFTFFPLFIALTLSTIAKYVGFFLAAPPSVTKCHAPGESLQFSS